MRGCGCNYHTNTTIAIEEALLEILFLDFVRKYKAYYHHSNLEKKVLLWMHSNSWAMESSNCIKDTAT